MIVSGFRMRTYSPWLARIPTLFPFENRRFTPFSIKTTCGNFSRINSMDPSVDPLSETMTSKVVECVPAKMEVRQSVITLRSFQHSMTIDSFIVGFFSGESHISSDLV